MIGNHTLPPDMTTELQNITVRSYVPFFSERITHSNDYDLSTVL